MALLLPLISFLIGYFGVQYLAAYRALLAVALARVLIPSIIIYNMVFYKAGSIWLIAFSMTSAFILFSLFYYFSKDKLRALCYSYLNGVWLGLPFALAVFGAQAMPIIIALYIGGSLFGNVSAVVAVSQTAQSWRHILKNMLQSPPVIALSIAAVLSIWDLSTYEFHPVVQGLYSANKFFVTFAGMCVLGMWLRHVRIQLSDLKRSLSLIAGRFILALGLAWCAYVILPIPHSALTYAVMMLYFLLPPAANIVALETHYQGTGRSAKYIASGTIASAILIGIYGMTVHALIPML